MLHDLKKWIDELDEIFFFKSNISRRMLNARSIFVPLVVQLTKECCGYKVMRMHACTHLPLFLITFPYTLIICLLEELISHDRISRQRDVSCRWTKFCHLILPIKNIHRQYSFFYLVHSLFLDVSFRHNYCRTFLIAAQAYSKSQQLRCCVVAMKQTSKMTRLDQRL